MNKISNYNTKCSQAHKIDAQLAKNRCLIRWPAPINIAMNNFWSSGPGKYGFKFPGILWRVTLQTPLSSTPCTKDGYRCHAQSVVSASYSRCLWYDFHHCRHSSSSAHKHITGHSWGSAVFVRFANVLLKSQTVETPPLTVHHGLVCNIMLVDPLVTLFQFVIPKGDILSLIVIKFDDKWILTTLLTPFPWRQKLKHT